jgi:hypothetical protein
MTRSLALRLGRLRLRMGRRLGAWRDWLLDRAALNEDEAVSGPLTRSQRYLPVSGTA